MTGRGSSALGNKEQGRKQEAGGGADGKENVGAYHWHSFL
jgi:hypothetical protein